MSANARFEPDTEAKRRSAAPIILYHHVTLYSFSMMGTSESMRTRREHETRKQFDPHYALEMSCAKVAATSIGNTNVASAKTCQKHVFSVWPVRNGLI